MQEGRDRGAQTQGPGCTRLAERGGTETEEQINRHLMRGDKPETQRETDRVEKGREKGEKEGRERNSRGREERTEVERRWGERV